MKKSMIAVAFIASISAVAQAAENTGRFESVIDNAGVSAKVGLNGVGFDVTKSFNDYFKVRVGYSQYKFNHDYDQDNVTYAGKLKVGGWDMLADYHPFGGGMRVTAGAYSSQTRFGADARYTSAGTVEINGNEYTSSQVPKFGADVKWHGVKPYLGIGYDGFNSRKNGGFYFTSDVGVIFAGSPKVTLTADCASSCSQLGDDLAAEKARIVDDLKDARWLPVVQVGVGYRF